MNSISHNTAAAPWRSKAGVSMVEVVIAVMVLGMVVASTIMALRTGFTMIQLARDNTMASQILQSEMENLRMMSWTRLNELPDEEEFQVDTQLDHSFVEKFSRTRRITPMNDPSGNERDGIKEVVLEIEWAGATGSTHRRVYRSRFGKEGLNDYYYRAF